MVISAALGLASLVLYTQLARAATSNAARVALNHGLVAASGQELCPGLNIAVESSGMNFAVALGGEKHLQVTIGLNYYASKDWERARQMFSTAPRDAASDFWRGCAEWRVGNSQAAFEIWRMAKAESYFINQGKQFYLNKQLALAEASYKAALQIAPDSSVAWRDFAQMQFDRAAERKLAWDIALEPLEKALRYMPDDPMLHYMVGYSLWLSGKDWVRAEKELRWAWGRDKNWLIAYTLGSLLADQGRYAEGRDLLEYAVAHSEHGWAHLSLLRVYAGLERCREADVTKVRMLNEYPEMLNPLKTWCRGYAKCPCNLYP